jgi:hypothetical protein
VPSEYFPGSRQQVTPLQGPPDPLAGVTGKMYPVGDTEVELFSISQLAVALDRQPVTIRKWERDGVIPRATFVKPGAGGDPRGRRRLYSRAQVEAMVRIAHEEGLLTDKHRQVTRTQFQAKVLNAFREIAGAR